MGVYEWTLWALYVLFVLPPWWAWIFLLPLYFLAILYIVNKIGGLYEKLRRLDPRNR